MTDKMSAKYILFTHFTVLSLIGGGFFQIKTVENDKF